MELEKRISVLIGLGKQLNKVSTSPTGIPYQEAYQSNPWFTPESINQAIQGIAWMLEEENLKHWLKAYNFKDRDAKTVGIVMAGNIPLVGFHDLLCVLISGHYALIKLSRQDTVLMNWIIDLLIDIEPAWKNRIEKREVLKGMDSVIATGSDNTSRYFEYYFRHIPHIIRKNRTAVAVIQGNETEADLAGLGNDIYQYFGLGCRNVSTVFIPESYDIRKLFPALDVHESIGDHHKYRNNYDYNKSIYLVNKVPHFDNGFSLWTQGDALVSPISVTYYQHYPTMGQLEKTLVDQGEKIQCVIGKGLKNAVAFGQAQRPAPWDYADNVDTLAFLAEL